MHILHMLLSRFFCETRDRARDLYS